MNLTTNQAATAIGLSDQAIRDHIDAGRLKADRIGIRGFIRIYVDELRRFASTYNYPVDETYLLTLQNTTK